jgi:hypothetical protein
MSFTECHTAEQMILDTVTEISSKPVSMVCDDAPPYKGESLGDSLHPTHWVIRANVAGLQEPVTQ